MAETLKLGEISKNLKITNKDIIAKLADHGIELKSAASVINEDIAGLIIDIYTQANEMSEEELIAERGAAVQLSETRKKEEEQATAAAAKAAEEELKKSEETKKSQPEKTDKKTEKPKPKTEKKDEKTTDKPRREKHKKVAKKQSGQKIDLSGVDRTNTDEEFVVKTEERKRHVDTRQSIVELDTIESRERIENMVPDSMKMDKKGGKVKNNKRGGKNRREKEVRKEKKVIPAKVITEIEVGCVGFIQLTSLSIGKATGELGGNVLGGLVHSLGSVSLDGLVALKLVVDGDGLIDGAVARLAVKRLQGPSGLRRFYEGLDGAGQEALELSNL